jgi:hypothetical protein
MCEQAHSAFAIYMNLEEDMIVTDVELLQTYGWRSVVVVFRM